MRVAIIAGETSGDLLGAGLMRSMQQQIGDVQFEGVAGPEMTAAGCEKLAAADELAVMGLVEPLARLPRLLRLRRMLQSRWIADPPDVFVGIDAPDFNLGLEKRLKAAGIKTVHYVSPSVWAWRQGRVRKIASAADCVLCLLPFEKAFYDDHDVRAEFVGHPMADRSPVHPDLAGARAELGIEAASVLAVLPGSRQGEVKRLGPAFVEACRLLSKTESDIRFIAPMASAGLKRKFEHLVGDAGLTNLFQLFDGRADRVIEAADVVLVASGTASLQTALLQKPMVAAYRLAPLTYAIAKGFNLVKVPHFALPNLLTSEPLVAEFLQDAATPAALATELAALFANADRRARIAAEFASLRQLLARNADVRAAEAVLSVAGVGG